MTCIVGLVSKRGVVIGGDSAGVLGYGITDRADEKVFRVGAYVIGFTSSFRMGQLIRYGATLPEPPVEGLPKFMSLDFVNAIRVALKEGGFAEKHNEAEQGGTFLVGVHGRLFRVESDYQVGEPRNGFTAVGSGESYAIGALAVSQGKPRQRVQQALEVAERFSAAVRGPFTILRS